MAEIIWTREALRWLEDIHAYIQRDRPYAADGVIGGIYEKVQLLRHHSRIGFRYENIPDREVRIILYGHYQIAYLIVSDQRIEILGIFHAAMEIERYL